MYILKQSKKGCFPIIQEFKLLKEAKAELFKIARYDGGMWFDQNGWLCEIIKK